ncbi:pyridoxal phosphate-dependent aminotransferase [Phenylobacterium sp.]|uniref:pyridoxal phosphate-dependent aminotransferase n=1 Tax=Phenylobacterium sp. TaxID=1871053 RepID=UPI00301CF844
MNRVQHPGAAEARRRAGSDALFDAASYSEWVRGAVRLREADPDTAILFESTISEPTADLMEVVRDAFSLRVSPRYVSVFADGNRYAVEALARRYGLSPNRLITTTGATSALALALKALAGDGGHVLVEQPGFDILTRTAQDAGARVEGFRRTARTFALDLDDLARRLTPRTRAVLVTNLHNPSGVLLDSAEIAAAAEVAGRVGAVLVVDEVYADFAAPPVGQGDAVPPQPASRLADNIVSVSSLTKVFGLFALKFGWLAAAPALVARIREAAPDGDMGVSKLTHALAAHVLEAPEVFEAHWKRSLAQTRPQVARYARTMAEAGLIEGELPPYGCMFFPRIIGVDDTRSLSRRLYEHHGVLVTPGEYFDAPGHLRIGFGADAASVAKGLERLETALRAGR